MAGILIFPPRLSSTGENQGKKETHPLSGRVGVGKLAALPTPRRPATTTEDVQRGALLHNHLLRIRGPGISVKHPATAFGHRHEPRAGQPPRLSGGAKLCYLVSAKSSRAALDCTAEGGCPHRVHAKSNQHCCGCYE